MVTDDAANRHRRHRLIDHGDLMNMSGMELAALWFPAPSASDVGSVNAFLQRHQAGAS